MAPAPSSQQPTPQRPTAQASKADNTYDDEMPSANELLEIAKKSLQTGAVTGGIGMMVGAGSGILRSAPPTLFALVAGLQWFGLGSTFMASRSLLWHALGGEENLSPSDHVKAGGVAGGVSGMVGGMFRGPRNIIPGILFFGTVGATGSYFSQRFRDSPKSDESKAKSGWLDSRWSPMKRLSDKEYEEKLEEKILRINAEIAIIDENIASLRASISPSSKPSGGEGK
ncbi:hypothetical protein F4821DRAFT_224199 [Hypoxylon rubiginosum]|uniref:Uncharacterized protein n=1 Tax=Hypoxylon rubiginosum TaxID=110542 RepID=A0ACC0DI50_9PEZI|nr:hypothetical protein F4821DRAFT_224199 [Hypoxylon rubiginosum]